MSKKKNEIVNLCNSRHHKVLVGDSVRKQKCAVTIFETAKKNKIRVCNLTCRGKSLSDKIPKMMAVFNEGKSNFKDLLR